METMNPTPSSARSSRSPSGARKDGVSGDRDHRLDLTIARGVDLLGQCGSGQFGQRLGMARYPAVPAAGRKPSARFRRTRRRHRRSEREHRPARPVQVAGQDVDDIHQASSPACRIRLSTSRSGPGAGKTTSTCSPPILSAKYCSG